DVCSSDLQRGADLPHVRHAGGHSRPLPRLGEHREQDRSQDGDNRYHDKQLDQRETASLFHWNASLPRHPGRRPVHRHGFGSTTPSQRWTISRVRVPCSHFACPSVTSRLEPPWWNDGYCANWLQSSLAYFETGA